MQTQVEQLYHPLLLYVKNRINNKEDAEDITQEVFYKLSKSGSSEVKNLKSWVYTIAKNTITDYYRRYRVQLVDVDKTPVHEEEVYDASTELSACISAYVAALPDEYRSVMTLSELQNVPQKEIAEKLGMNYVTVRSKIQRGRKKLREMFLECCTIVQGGKGSIVEYIKKCNQDSGCGPCS